MTSLARALPGSGPAKDRADRLIAMVDPRFLDEVGWDPATMLLSPGPHHPLMGRGVCRVAECAAPAVSRVICQTCAAVWRCGESIDIEEFVLVPRTAPTRRVGVCVVPGCPRPRGRRIATGLCSTHDTNYLLYRHLSVEQFCALPHVVPLPDFGFCQVPCCDRRCDSSVSLCPAHRGRWRRESERDPRADRRDWVRTTRPVAMGSVVGLGVCRRWCSRRCCWVCSPDAATVPGPNQPWIQVRWSRCGHAEVLDPADLAQRVSGPSYPT